MPLSSGGFRPGWVPNYCTSFSLSRGQNFGEDDRFLNKVPSPARLDADADVCGGQQAQPEQPIARVVLVLHPETGAKTRFLAILKSPPVINQKFTNSGDSPQYLDVDVHGVPPVVKEHPVRSQMPRQGVLWDKAAHSDFSRTLARGSAPGPLSGIRELLVE